MQIGRAEQEVEDQHATLESSDIGIQGALHRDMAVPLLDEGTEEPHIPEGLDPSMASGDLDDPHDPVTWTPSWGFEGFDGLEDIETIFQ